MKRLIIAFKLLFIWSCSGPEHKLVEQEPYPSKDSILQLADEVLEYIINKETLKKSELDSLSKTLLHNQDASTQQILNMATELQLHRTEKEGYAEELDAYKTKRIVTKDCIIYNVDTHHKKYYITDTLYDTVTIYYVDTIRKRQKRWKK
tara:strand:+ start:318 stop:764 length:447 start_codon:yes stop_codon:yes gene_type:complete